MGNKQGSNAGGDGDGTDKRKEDTKKEDEKQKRKQLEKKVKKKDGKKKKGKLYQDDEFDFDESSHVTGDDSESGVFHSAENVSMSPYLNSCTLSELEQMGRASAGTSSWASSSGGSRLNYEHHHQFQHPKILSSSRDFRDGFSLEACIPPEIARPERYNPPIGRDIAEEGDGENLSELPSTSSLGRLDRSKDGSGKSRRSNTSSGGSHHVTPTSSRSKKDTSTGADGDGYSTPLLSTPVFSRAQKDRHSPSATPFSYTPYTDPDSSIDISASPSKSSGSYNIFNHPFFHKGSHKKERQQQQHQQHQTDQRESSKQLKDHPHHLVADYKNLPKPTSPHPQRRALSPKMTSSPFKLISSDSSSSSPTTPTPQRRAANLLNLLRPGGSKKSKGKSSTSEKDSVSHKRLEHLASDQSKDWRGTGDIDTETSTLSRDSSQKRKPRWKTWERSSRPKKTSEKAKRVSIFGTSRKSSSGKNKKERRSSQGIDVVRPSSAAELSSRDRTSSSRSSPPSVTLVEIAEATRAKQMSTSVKVTSTTKQAMDSGEFERQSSKHSEKEPASQPHSSSSLSRRIQQAAACGQGGRNSSRSSDSNLDSKTITPSASEGMSAMGGLNRASSSPPTTKSAAFCIMRLEELERAIENTIREKFPDAEPFILRKPNSAARDEETKGSRSLPTTPSLKKKRYLTRDDKEADSNGSSRHSRNGDASCSNGEGTNGTEGLRTARNGTQADSLSKHKNRNKAGLKLPSTAHEDAKGTSSRSYDVAYESVPSPTMSPVILRRFGARARHASISPKVPRAKTAALYNSPSELPKVEEPSPPVSPTQVTAAGATPGPKPPVVTHDLSSVLRKVSLPAAFPRVAQTDRLSGTDGATLGSGLIGTQIGSGSHTNVASGELTPLSLSQKSNSKYDNVMDDEEMPLFASVIKASGKTQTAYVTKESERVRAPAPTTSTSRLHNSPKLVRQRRLEENITCGDYDKVYRNGNKHGKVTNAQNQQMRSRNVGSTSGLAAETKKKELDMRDEKKKVTDTESQGSVIIPSTSAVFGSVSPKLKRHLLEKSEEQKVSDRQKPIQIVDLHPGLKRTSKSNIVTTSTTKEDTKTNIKQMPIKSLSLDSPTQSRHFEDSTDSLFVRPTVTVGASPTNASPTLISSAETLSPSRQSSSNAAQSPGTGSASSKPSVEATSALSVRERVRSLNKSVSEGWSGPVSPTSPPLAQQPSSPLSPMLGPQPYPHFTPDRSGGRQSAGSSSGVRQLSLRHQASTLASPPVLQPPPSFPQRPQYLTPHQHPPLSGPSLSKHRAGFGTDSAIPPGPISPGPSRKHSTDHVVFGSAVALPCRVYAQVTSPTHPHSSQSSQLTPPAHQQSKQVTSPTSLQSNISSPFLPPPPHPRSPTSPSHSPALRVQQDKKRVHLVRESSSPLSSAHVRNVEPIREQSGERYASTGDQVQNAGNSQELCRNVEEEVKTRDETELRSKAHAAELSAHEITHSSTRRSSCEKSLTTSAQHKETVSTTDYVQRTKQGPVDRSNLTLPDVIINQRRKPGSESTSQSTQFSEAGVPVSTSSSCSGAPSVSLTSGTRLDQHHSEKDFSYIKGKETKHKHTSELNSSNQSGKKCGGENKNKKNYVPKRAIDGQTSSSPQEEDNQSKDKDSSLEPLLAKVLKHSSTTSEDEKKCRRQNHKGKPEGECMENTRQENVESPDVYKPSLRYVEVEVKPTQRQPLSKVISDMISVSSQSVHQSLPTTEVDKHHSQHQALRQEQPQQQQQRQQHQQQHEQQQQQQQLPTHRQRRRRQQPPEHHQQKLNLVFENQQHQKTALKSSDYPDVQAKRVDLRDDEEVISETRDHQHQQQVKESVRQRPPLVAESSDLATSKANLKTTLYRPGDNTEIETPQSKDSMPHVASRLQPAESSVKCESKEMQTDIVTKADKGVDSWNPPLNDPALVLKRDGASGETARIPRARQASDQDGQGCCGSERTPSSEELDLDFLEKVKSLPGSTVSPKIVPGLAKGDYSQPNRLKNTKESSKSQAKVSEREVPPPSPTAMERLMQEMAEEDSDEDEQERKEIEQAMRRETEMKEFTEKIYKRLSDLLGSHSCDEGEEEYKEEEDDDKIDVASGGVIVKGEDEVFEEDSMSSARVERLKEHSPELERPDSFVTTEEDRVRSPSYNTGDSLRTTDYDSLENKGLLARGFVFNASGRAGSPLDFSDDEPSQLSDYRPAVTPRVLTIESSSSLTTTTESESEVEETPVIIFKPPPAEQTTELRRLRDYREDPELPTLLRKAIISRNMGSALWDDEDRRQTRSPVLEEVFERKTEPSVFVFPERSIDYHQQHVSGEQETKSFEETLVHDQAEDAIPYRDPPLQRQLHYQQRRSSREYHSDDDVVSGRGVPEYYDDSTLWVSRRPQRPPVQFSQLSLAVVAQRRRERRERWLKKRRRNRTDLVSSTGGSSDTDREHRPAVTGQHHSGPRQASQPQAPQSATPRRIPAQDRRHILSGSSLEAYEDYPEDKTQGDERNPHDMGSGILASPKYAKPIILPFMGGAVRVSSQMNTAPVPSARQEEGEQDADKRAENTYNPESDSNGVRYSQKDSSTTHEAGQPYREECDDDKERGMAVTEDHRSSAIPGIEETFNELKSVQNILEGLQDRKGAPDTKPSTDAISKGRPPIPNPALLSPLTTENLRSLRSYDKSGSSRRSRMSLTDRTESDLDLYSERGCDDENSSGSEYADDEGEGDNGDDEETCYNTAEDDLDPGSGSARRLGSGLTTSDTTASRKSGNLSDDSESTDFLVSCTFYNSNVSPPDLANTTGTESSAASATAAVSSLNTATSPYSRTAGRHAELSTTPSSVPSSGPLMTVSSSTTTAPSPSLPGLPTLALPSQGQGHISRVYSSGGSAGSDPRQVYPIQGYQQQQQQTSNLGVVPSVHAGPPNPQFPQRSTFQSARNQMQDIQSHLQALRRQMAVLPDDDDICDVTDRTMASSNPGTDGSLT